MYPSAFNESCLKISVSYFCVFFYIELRLLPGALFAVAGWCQLERVQSAQINVLNRVLCGTVIVCHSLPATFLSNSCL